MTEVEAILWARVRANGGYPDAKTCKRWVTKACRVPRRCARMARKKRRGWA